MPRPKCGSSLKDAVVAAMVMSASRAYSLCMVAGPLIAAMKGMGSSKSHNASLFGLGLRLLVAVVVAVQVVSRRREACEAAAGTPAARPNAPVSH